MPADFGNLHCWRWVFEFVQGLCLRGVVVETGMVHYGSLSLDYCQLLEPLRLIMVNEEVAMVDHFVVLTAILRN